MRYFAPLPVVVVVVSVCVVALLTSLLRSGIQEVPTQTIPQSVALGDNMWLLGQMDGDEGSRPAPRQFQSVGLGSHPGLAVRSSLPLRVVSRAPVFIRRVRGTSLPAAPNGSLHLEGLPPEAPADAISPCLSTSDASLRRMIFRQWTIEATALLLDTPRFGRIWQTIVGRNGFNHSTNPQGAALPTFALKLSPSGRFVLLAWFERDLGTMVAGRRASPYASVRPPDFVSVESEHVAQPNVWYHLVVSFDGAVLQLAVNGVTESRVTVRVPSGGVARLAQPRRPTDGDWTFGCGMHNGVAADTCSCLLTEARLVDRALDEHELSWHVVSSRRE